MNRIRFYYLFRVLFSALAGVALGLFVLWADAYAVEVFDVLMIATGVLALAFNLPVFLLSLRAIAGKEKWEWINLAVSALSMGFGVCFMLISRTAPALPVLLLLYILLIPIAHISLVSERAKQFRLELPKIVFGGLLLVATVNKSEDVMFLVLGGGLVVISVLYLAFKLWKMPQACRPYTEKFDQ